MAIPHDKIEQIRNVANIVEIVGEYIPLKKIGKNYVGLCPFHNETSPSFTVSEEKQIFHCFGCGIGGNVFHFLMRYRQCSFREAVEEVANRYGLSLPKTKMTPKEEEAYHLKKDILTINEQAARFYHQYLTEEKDAERAREYLRARGIGRDTISDYMLGYAPPRWDALTQFLQRKGVSTALAIQGGLLIEREDGGVYDRFRDRIIFPIFDSRDRVIAFGGRVLGDGLPKYINSPETPVYQKSFCLYGANVAKVWSQKEGKVILVEGYFDLLSLHARGIRYAVASLGTALTPAQVRLLKGLSPHIILIYDGDAAGKKAAKRSIPLFLKEDILVDIALLPEGQDPDSFISQVGKEGFLNLLSQAKPLIDWYLASGEEETRDNFERRYQFLQEASNVIFQFKNPFKKSHYIGKLCQLFHVDQALIQDLHKNSRDISLGSDLLAAFLNSLTPDERFQLKTIRYLFSYPQMVHEFARGNAFKDIVHPLFRQLLDLICEIYERKNELSLNELLLNTQEDIIKSLITKWAIETSPFKLEDGYEILRAIKQKRLKRERQKILTKIKDAEERKDFSEVLELLKEEKRLIKQTEAV